MSNDLHQQFYRYLEQRTSFSPGSAPYDGFSYSVHENYTVAVKKLLAAGHEYRSAEVSEFVSDLLALPELSWEEHLHFARLSYEKSANPNSLRVLLPKWQEIKSRSPQLVRIPGSTCIAQSETHRYFVVRNAAHQPYVTGLIFDFAA